MKKTSAHLYGNLVRHNLKFNQQTLDCLRHLVKTTNETLKPRTNVSEMIEILLRTHPKLEKARKELGFREWDARKPNGRPTKKPHSD